MEGFFDEAPAVGAKRPRDPDEEEEPTQETEEMEDMLGLVEKAAEQQKQLLEAIPGTASADKNRGFGMGGMGGGCLLYTSPSPRDKRQSRMPSSA